MKVNTKAKRLPCAALALVVATIGTVRQAEATYVGTLEQASPHTVEVSTLADVSMAILVVTSRGRLDVEETLNVIEP